MLKIKTMGTLIQKNRNRFIAKNLDLNTFISRDTVKFLKMISILGLFIFFIVLSLTNGNLHLTEISTGGAIVIMLSFIRIYSE